MYEVKDPFWQFIDHWQTLITGLLALAAGVGTVWATIKSASRDVAAAQAQTQAAQHQTEVMRELERRRLAREGYAFHMMLEAAMGAVIEDVAAAQKLPRAPPPSASQTYSMQAYPVRQRVKRAAFPELRGAFLRFGGPLTALFLRLDKDIEDFTAQCIQPVNPATGFAGQPVGVNANLDEQLGRIEQQEIGL